MCSQEKNSGIPHLYPREQEAEEKRQKQLLLYLHPTKLHKEQSLLHSQGLGCVRHSPRWSGQEGLGLEGHQFFLRGAWDSSSFQLLTFKELQTTGPWSPISLLSLTVHKNLLSKGAVAPE